ncbi:MAG: response regulator [Chloroflexi bacterium]|nr:response regulator [Chloroflexota bacterium]
MQVLVAEDEKFSRTILTSMVERWGYEPVVVENGQQAWDVLQKADAPKLVLLDWYMPEMNGLEVIQKVRSQSNSRLPYIILLTANAEKDDVVQGITAGANDYILKPYDRDELHDRIEKGKRIVESLLLVNKESPQMP